MDNSVSPISSISPEPTDHPSIEQSIHRWSFWIIGGIFLIGLGIIIGVFLGVKFLSQSQNPFTSQDNITQEVYPTVTITTSTQQLTQPISSPTPEPIIPTTVDPTASSPSPTTVRRINYSPPSGWTVHSSPLGFTFFYPLSYTSPKYEVTKRLMNDGTSLQYCVIDLRENNPSNYIQFLLAPYPGGSRRQFLMDITGLYSGDLKSTQEVQLGGLSGLLASFKTPYGSPPVLVSDETTILIQNPNVALVIYSSTVTPNLSQWTGLLSSLKIESNLTADLNKCN